jgi:catechol 2,3-dioxygenase-like lactoylglutathione lyase family enzyme
MQEGTPAQDFQGSTLDHLNISVTDIDASLEFYERTLNAIGIIKVFDIPGDDDEKRPRMVGFGYEHKPFFWIVDTGRPDPNLHVAFSVASRNLVRRFFEAAQKAGAEIKLEPAVHPEYHENYYGAFIYDPDGANIEAVCHVDDEDAVAFVESQGQATAAKS